MKLSAAILCAFGFFLIPHTRCTEIRDEEFSGPQRHFMEHSSDAKPAQNHLRQLVEDSDRHVMENRHKRQSRWNFANVTGDISNIHLDGSSDSFTYNGVEITKSHDITCIDSNGKTTKGLNFSNISGNVRDLKCYVDGNGQRIQFDFGDNSSGTGHNIRIISAGKIPNSGFAMKPSLVYTFVMTVLIYFTMC